MLGNYPPGVTEADIDEAVGENDRFECALCHDDDFGPDFAEDIEGKTYCLDCAREINEREALRKVIEMKGYVAFHPADSYSPDRWLVDAQKSSHCVVQCGNDPIALINTVYAQWKAEAHKRAEHDKQVLETCAWAGYVPQKSIA